MAAGGTTLQSWLLQEVEPKSRNLEDGKDAGMSRLYVTHFSFAVRS